MERSNSFNDFIVPTTLQSKKGTKIDLLVLIMSAGASLLLFVNESMLILRWRAISRKVEILGSTVSPKTMRRMVI